MNPILKPEIIIPDTSPLIHLAAAGMLNLLNQAGEVVLVDMVVLEATERLDKPYARDIADWIKECLKPGSNQPLRIVQTEIGELYAAKKLVDPVYKSRGAGEAAVLMWLSEEVEKTGREVMVVYENGKVPELIRRNALDIDIAVLTTRAFLRFAAEKGYIDDAEAVWRAIAAVVPSVSAADDRFIRRRSFTDTIF
ncbi:MAG: hypothetical protein LW855_05575 [Alphaproteobacteria bacterium]|jgi:predicted nucleic acid-binding protein|nr:hypothetical protein [Alphaproteobacteria bacterium]